MKRFKINGLFGQKNYDVYFADGGISIIIGPNGSGKTTILKIIDSFFF